MILRRKKKIRWVKKTGIYDAEKSVYWVSLSAVGGSNYYRG